MTFFRSVVAVFRGTRKFPDLAENHPFRSLLHLILFCLLTAVLGAGIRTALTAKTVHRCAEGLNRELGELRFCQGTVFPEKKPGTPRTFYLPGNSRLDYLPADSLALIREMPSWHQKTGILWLTGGFFVWVRPNPVEDSYIVTGMSFPDGENDSPRVVQQGIPSESLRKELTPYAVEIPKKGENHDIELSELSSLILSVFGIYTVFSMLFGNLILCLLTILVFAAMQSFWHSPGLEKFGFGKTFSLLIYAAFPALLAGVVFEAFTLPVSFETVFFIVFFIEQLLAFSAVRRALAGRNPEHGKGE